MAIGLSPNLPRQQYTPQIPQDVPVYKILDEKGFYSDDALIPFGEYIVWEEEPNPFMQPMNQLAQNAFIDYLEKLDKFGREWALSEKKSYVSQVKQYKQSLGLEEAADMRRAKVLSPKKEAPIMGAKREGPTKARRVVVDASAGTPMMGTSDKVTVNKVKNTGVDKSII